jgi:hypothetical protein
MATIGGSYHGDLKRKREAEPPASKFQLRLAASVIDALIARNADRDTADAFWSDDSFNLFDDKELDSEFGGLVVETVPEIDDIRHNIYECD